MEIVVETDVEITDVDTLTAFAVRSTLAPETIDIRLRAAGLGFVIDDHVWILADELERRGTVLSSNKDWSTGYGGMLAYARSKGWWDAERAAVRAHIIAH